MGKINENKGYGVARDGRHFSPAIPTGATVSWKRLPSAIHVEQYDKNATHLLAVWDRLEEMSVSASDLRKTARGTCVVFLADVPAIERLLESPVPRPDWLGPAAEDARGLAASLAGLHARWVSPYGTHTEPSVSCDLEWLTAAVLSYHQVTGEWPILLIDVPRVLNESPFPADRLRAEAGRVFEELHACLAGRPSVTRPVGTIRTARRV
jgi:hypothetical protein